MMIFMQAGHPSRAGVFGRRIGDKMLFSRLGKSFASTTTEEVGAKANWHASVNQVILFGQELGNSLKPVMPSLLLASTAFIYVQVSFAIMHFNLERDLRTFKTEFRTEIEPLIKRLDQHISSTEKLLNQHNNDIESVGNSVALESHSNQK